MIIDNDAKTMMIVEPEKKQYMLMTQEDAKQMQAMMGPMMSDQQHATDPSKYKFAKTGKSEVVAGAPCEMWHGEYTGEKGEKEEGDACVAEGVGFALADLTFNNPMLQQTGAARDQMEQFRQLVGGNKGHPQGHQHQGRQAVDRSSRRPRSSGRSSVTTSSRRPRATRKSA